MSKPNVGERIIDQGIEGTVVMSEDADPNQSRYLVRVHFDDGSLVNYDADDWEEVDENGVRFVQPAPPLEPRKYNWDA